jgi:regulatory protein YycI of two-component signal transduction system YycFG
MDVSKAKVIIIVLLAAFNIFLLSSNLTHVRSENTSEIISNTVTILKQRGITLECGIPKEMGTFHGLRYGNGKLDRASIAGKLLGGTYELPDKGDVYENNGKKLEFSGDMKFVFTEAHPSSGFDLRNDDKLKKTVQDFLKGTGLIDKNYVIDQYTRNQDGNITVKFIEKYENYLVYDNYCKVSLTAAGIMRLDYSKYQIIGFSNGKIVQTEAYQALLAYYKDGADKTLTGIDCGYILDNSNLDGKESVEVPLVWRAKVKGESNPVFLNVETSEDKTAQ